MKLIKFIISTLALLAPLTAHAEYINGQLTWVAQDKVGIGVVTAEPGSALIRHWTTNGTTYDCTQEYANPAEFKVIVRCPTINYRIEMQRDQILIASNSGVAKYPGSWDDRRTWHYQTGNITGTFTFQAGLKWFEQQRGPHGTVAVHVFRETWRDATFIYMFDETRTVHIALTRTGASMLLQGDSAYKALYAGSW